MMSSTQFDKRQCIVFAASLLASVIAYADSKPMTTSDNQAQLAISAPEIQAFLLKAEAADQIEDPLARCLAFPDLPGNKWPVGLTKAHCEYSQGPHITLARVKELLDRGQFSEIDAIFSADLDRHFSKDNFSEIIHRDFHAFDASKESEQLTKAWLEKSPKSPYALTARGFYYREMSREARGTKVAADTPDENVKRMGEFVDLAVEQFQKALEIEPRMLPAYTMLISMGKMDSRFDLKRNAIRDAKKIDPACSVAIDFEMEALTPRWGGSYNEMTALSDEISNFADKRPLLTNSMAAAYADLGDSLYIDKNYSDAIKVLKPVTPLATDAQIYQELAKSMFASDTGDRFEIVMYFLMADRFQDGNAFDNRTTGRILLMDARKPVWAAKYLRRAIEQSPDDSFAHYYLGKAYLYSANLADAETQFLISQKDPKTRRDSLLDISGIYMRGKQPEKALEKILILNKEYPDFAPGWIYSARIMQSLGQPGYVDALRKFVKTANRNDPTLRGQVEEVERELKAVKP